MAFTENEVAYLKSQPLARLATVDADGQPDVVPVGFEFDGTYLYVGGRAPERTKKFLNVKAGQVKVAQARLLCVLGGGARGMSELDGLLGVERRRSPAGGRAEAAA